MSNRKPYRPIITGVSFHPEVIQYLNELREEEDLDRSALINRIVREHARRRRGDGRLTPVTRKARVGGVGAVY